MMTVRSAATRTLAMIGALLLASALQTPVAIASDDEGNTETNVNTNTNTGSDETQNTEQEQERERNGRDKVTICHIPPGNPANMHSISIGEPALYAHRAHGDPNGACEDLFPEYFADSEDDASSDDTADSDDGTASDDGSADDGDDTVASASGTGEDDGENLLRDPVVDEEGPCSFLLLEDYASGNGFYVISSGNLDTDDDFSAFYRGGFLNTQCEIEGTPRVVQESSLE